MKNVFFSIFNRFWLILPLLVVFSFGSVFMLQMGENEFRAYFWGGIFLSIILFVLRFSNCLSRLTDYLAEISFDWKVVIIIGFILRVLWFIAFPTSFSSDSLVYVGLANKLIDGQPYEAGGMSAYWPPGFPLFLTLTHLLTFKVTGISIVILNFVIFFITARLLFKVSELLLTRKAALISLLLFCLWPNHIALTAIASKELLVFLILLGSVYFFLNFTGGYFVNRILIGVMFGAAVLVQPGTILFITVFIVYSWFKKEKPIKQLTSIILYLAAASAVVAPWTIRNYQVFHEFVMVSTNGGWNLYRANNELANGGYTKTAKIDLSRLTELQMDKKGKELAFNWISDNPVKFFKLSFKKMVLFLGDDSSGIYVSLRRGASEPIQSKYIYYFWKLISSLFWLLLWLIVLSKNNQLITSFYNHHVLVLIGLSFLYFFTIHAVFESNAKYHIPVVWAVFILVSALVCKVDKFDMERD